MVGKCNQIKTDDFSCWTVKKSFNNNEIEYTDDEERSITFSVNLLLKNKNISQPNFLQLPSHLITSPDCQCHRSYHIFCTDLYPEHDQDIDMIHIHPAPRNHEKSPSHRISSSCRKSHHRILEDNDHDTIVTTRSEPCHVTNTESQLLEKKLSVPPKLQPRTASLNIPSVYRTVQNSFKYPLTVRPPKQSTSFIQLKIRATSVFDRSPSTSQLFNPKGPPPSPKTPTQESSMILLNPITPPPPLRAIPLIPHARNSNENEKKIVITPSLKSINYEDHAKEYLSASDASDDENNNDNDNDDDEEKDKILTIIQPKSPVRTQSLSRPGTSLRDRLLNHNNNRFLKLAEVYYSPLEIHKILSEKSRRPRLIVPTNDNDETATTITKTTTAKTTPIPQSKSVFGFSKTASSMHFGHAAGRLGLHGSFEKWPQTLSRRTPIERKQEVTTLRLVTLPLVTS